MKSGERHVFIAIASVALLAVIIIQWNWIIESEKHKQEQFNEKANIILARTTEELSSHKELSEKLRGTIGKAETRKIDSLLRHYMNYYGFRHEYSFRVTTDSLRSARRIEGGTGSFSAAVSETNCFEKSLSEKANAHGWQLKLSFPKREEVILQELRTSLLASAALILLVFILLWRTVLLFSRQKKISEDAADFLNNMIHEFKTPLACISLAGKMIRNHAMKKHEQEITDTSTIILDESERLRVEVEKLLTMYVPDDGNIPMQKTELDMHQIIKESLRSMNVHLDKANQPQLELNAHEVVVLGDRTHLTKNTECS